MIPTRLVGDPQGDGPLRRVHDVAEDLAGPELVIARVDPGAANPIEER